MILQRYYKYQEELERERSGTSPVQSLAVQSPTVRSQDRISTKEQMERQDHLMALQLQELETTKSSRATTRAKQSKARNTKVTKKSSERPKTAFHASLTLSPQLADLVGHTQLSRPQVVKQLWNYIKKYQLQNPEDKRKLICDEKMQKVFKKKSVSMFEMNRLLNAHLFKSDEILDSPEQAQKDGDLNGPHKNETIKDTSKNGDTFKGGVENEMKPDSTKIETAKSDSGSDETIKLEELEDEVSDVDD